MHQSAWRRSSRRVAHMPMGATLTSMSCTKRQIPETDRAKRETILYEIQKILHDRTRFAPIYDYIWPSGVGPRVEESALMLINPYPWAAPLEEVRLKQP